MILNPGAKMSVFSTGECGCIRGKIDFSEVARRFFLELPWIRWNSRFPVSALVLNPTDLFEGKHAETGVENSNLEHSASLRAKLYLLQQWIYSDPSETLCRGSVVPRARGGVALGAAARRLRGDARQDGAAAAPPRLAPGLR